MQPGPDGMPWALCSACWSSGAPTSSPEPITSVAPEQGALPNLDTSARSASSAAGVTPIPHPETAP
ncbi:MAG: hypothetical protein SFX73_31860 [Kofleriaceae bacterium]|nr:hypothetical protein [Kofleriaceae bacterium]